MLEPQPPVHWEEGMFLCPQHLQALTQHLDYRLAINGISSSPYAYGVTRALEIDAGALKNHQFSLRSGRLVTAQGTLIDIPETARPKDRLFESELAEARGALEVYLGVPLRREREPLVVTPSSGEARYRVDEDAMMPDENTGEGEVAVKRRHLNARLFLGGEPSQGYETIKVAEIVRKSQVDPEPVLSTDFIPPLMRMQASPALARWVKEVADDLRSTNQALAKDMSQRPVTWAMKAGADSLFKLHATNTFVPVIEQGCLGEGVHPFSAYLLLSQLAGSLAIFDERSRSCPPIALYDHENPAPLFRDLCGKIKKLLQNVWKTTWDVRPFVANPANPRELQCELPQGWVNPPWVLYLGVTCKDTNLGPRNVNIDDIRKTVVERVKLVPSNAASDVRGQIVGGLSVQMMSQSPPSLPPLADTYYFLIDERTTPAQRWAPMKTAKSLAMLWAGQPAPGMEFSLYAGMENRG